MNGLIGLGGTVSLLLLFGVMIGLADRQRFAFRWLVTAALLVAFNDLMLTRGYRVIPNLFAGSDWNWEGKALALGVTLALAALPIFGWRHVGLTLKQKPGSLKTALPVAAIYCAFFLALALMFPAEPANADEIAFQLTMPGFEEEPFYRGILLVALDRAFLGRVRFLGVDWGWGALVSCLLFGMAHAFGYSNGHFSLDPLTMALTAVPALIAVWLRLRTGILLASFSQPLADAMAKKLIVLAPETGESCRASRRHRSAGSPSSCISSNMASARASPRAHSCGSGSAMPPELRSSRAFRTDSSFPSGRT